MKKVRRKTLWTTALAVTLGVLSAGYGASGATAAASFHGGWPEGVWLQVQSPFEICGPASVCAEYLTGGEASPFEPCCLSREQLGSADPYVCASLTPTRPEESEER